MQPKKTVLYRDERNDDFASGARVRPIRPVTAEYHFAPKNLFWRFVSFFLYRIIATPFALLYCRFVHGIRIKNRRAIRKLKGGFFLYGNHTQSAFDAFDPTLVAFPRRVHIVTGNNAVAIPAIRRLVPMLGGIPLATDLGGAKCQLEALQTRIRQGAAVAIYPEAHIWPYCNFIRDFPAASFGYPVRFGVPAVSFTATYRKSKFFRRPRITVYVGEPVYPDPSRPALAEKKRIRDEIYRQMTDACRKSGSVAYIEYLPAPRDTGDMPETGRN